MHMPTKTITLINYALYMVILSFILTACEQKEKSVATPELEKSEVSLPTWITKDYVMGNFEPKGHEDFQLIDAKYADREGLYLHKQALEDFKKMWNAAKADGVNLIIKSATRNFSYQKGIWERKWTGQTELSDGTKASDEDDAKKRALKILLYSSMPGTSRHHWGTDIDLNNFNNSYFEAGVGQKVYEWLQEHAASFGFCQPYTDKSGGRTGYEEEKWHWSYVPLSKDLTRFCKQQLRNQDISGFEGSEVATSVNMLDNYILGIGPNCL